jgi:hypothetical protein
MEVDGNGFGAPLAAIPGELPLFGPLSTTDGA